MIVILLSILCSTLIILSFKVFEKYKIDLFQAIVANYFSCVALGWIPMTNQMEVGPHIFSEAWFPYSIIMGVLFISIFFLIGLTTQKVGVAPATVAMRLTIIFPIIFAFTFYQETINFPKLVGIVLALIAIVLISMPKKNTPTQKGLESKWLVLLPFIIFFGSGSIDVMVQYVEKSYFSEGGFEAFIILIFGTAGLIGFAVLLYKLLAKGERINGRSVLGGLLLGIPNYGSMYFFFKALNLPGWESSVIFPINNIGIIVTASVAAMVLFRERLSKVNQIGLLCAVASFIFIYLGRGGEI